MLKAPDFEQVYQWRQKQERKLIASLGSSKAESDSSGIMNEKQLRDFVVHFERLSRHCIAIVPELANRIYLLDREHRIESCLQPLLHN